ncbi:MAG: hypothetical protein ABSA21_07645 [Candidatus Limnocylindrales bacterium]
MGVERTSFEGPIQENLVLFSRKRSKGSEERQIDQAGLVELLLDADETERKRLLLLALQTGELRKSEAADLLRLVDRLEAVAAGTSTRAKSGGS